MDTVKNKFFTDKFVLTPKFAGAGSLVDNYDISFEEYYEDVLRFLRGLSRDEYLAEELTQETFCRAMKSIHSFRGDCDLRIWLCSIAKNLFFTYRKKQQRVVSGEALNEYESEEKMLVQIMADRETAKQIHRILHDLNEPYKEIFSLRIFGELSFKEIAELFQKSEHWACVTYHRAKEMIRKELKV